MFIKSGSLTRLSLFGVEHLCMLPAAVLFLCLFLFDKKKFLRKPVVLLGIFSAFLFVLNPSVVLQFIFFDRWGDFYNSVPNLLLLYANLLATIFLGVDLYRNKPITYTHLLFTVLCVFQYFKIDMVLFSAETKNTFLNDLSKAGYIAYFGFYMAMVAYQWIEFARKCARPALKSSIDFAFMFWFGFPTVLFSRLGLVYTAEGMIDFYGIIPYIGIRLWSVNYFLIAVYFLAFTAGVVFYFYKPCGDKKGFVYKLLFTLLLTSYIRRGTYFYKESLGLAMLLDSPCAFFPLAYLLYLAVEKRFLAQYCSFFILPMSVGYVVTIASTGYASMFSFFTIDSILFHICIAPLSLTVFYFTKFENTRDALYNTLFILGIQIFYGALGNAAGYLEYAGKASLNAGYFYGFMYKYSFFSFLEPLVHFGQYVAYGLRIHPMNYILMAAVAYGLSSSGQSIYRYARRKQIRPAFAYGLRDSAFRS